MSVADRHTRAGSRTAESRLKTQWCYLHDHNYFPFPAPSFHIAITHNIPYVALKNVSAIGGMQVSKETRKDNRMAVGTDNSNKNLQILSKKSKIRGRFPELLAI